MIRTLFAAATLAVAIAPPAAAQGKPGALKTFRDWTVGCDNTLRCQMIALGPQEAGDQPAAAVKITREAGPAGAFSVAYGDHDGAPLGASVDGRRLDPKAGAAFVAAIANATALVVTGADGKRVGTLSLAGVAAALRYIDAAQGRVGGVTAAIAEGTVPASAVPAPPALPVVTAIAPAGKPAKPTTAQVAAMRKAAACDLPDTVAADFSPEAFALGGGRTLVLLPCSTGAYNMSSAMFVMTAGGAPVLAKTDAPTGFGESGADAAMVVNGAFEKGLVTSYAKGRGIGDCGVAQTLAWDGARMRLVGQAEMGECRGSTDLITTWRARVVRK